MDFRYLHGFLAAVEGPTLAAAAKRLRIAPSALTRQLQLFEVSVGEELFERKVKSVKATPKAMELAKQTQLFLQSFSSVLHNQPQELLRVQTLEGGLSTYLLPALSQKALPHHINFDIRLGSTREIEDALRAREVDMGLLSHKLEGHGLRCKLVMTEQMALIFHRPIALQDIHKERWIYVFEGSYLYRLNKNAPVRTLRVESLQAVLDFVEAKQGLAVVPERIITNRHSLFRLPLEKFRKERLYLVWQEDLSHGLLRFVEDVIRER